MTTAAAVACRDRQNHHRYPVQCRSLHGRRTKPALGRGAADVPGRIEPRVPDALLPALMATAEQHMSIDETLDVRYRKSWPSLDMSALQSGSDNRAGERIPRRAAPIAHGRRIGPVLHSLAASGGGSETTAAGTCRSRKNRCFSTRILRTIVRVAPCGALSVYRRHIDATYKR